jgi:hypothetical protein
MRYIKKLSLSSKSPQDDRLSALQDGRIVTESVVSMEVPAGTTAQRSSVSGSAYNGMIRYNTTFNEFEIYNYNNPSSTRWEFLRTVRQATITPQNLGYGNYNDTIFGPLSYSIDAAKPQNILVFVDNVYQVPTTNYTLTSSPTASTSTLSDSTATSVSTLYLTTTSNIDVGDVPGTWRTVTANAAGVQVGTTVTSVSTTFSSQFQGYAMGISLPTTSPLTTGTIITVAYNSGTYIQFTGAVPLKPVFALLGMDGYFPAGPSGTAFES